MLKLLAILAVTTLVLPAADGATSSAGQRSALRQQMLERFDADHDGTLSDSERATAKAACQKRLSEAKAKFDADHDGKLSDSERDAARAAFSIKLKEKHPELFAKIDTNGDGTLSREEAQAARKLRREHRQAGK